MKSTDSLNALHEQLILDYNSSQTADNEIANIWNKQNKNLHRINHAHTFCSTKSEVI